MTARMSHDAQHRTPQPLADVSTLVRARLGASGYPFTGQILECAECGPRSTLHLTHDLIDDDWSMHCSRCRQRLGRTYLDPIDVICRWNQTQLERAKGAGA